ncbi:IS110 family transposase [Rhodococcus sp. (in: high G+C Gram-positive bacteria)]|uniref:IS110 family transposase n=1 Tax=unclassified Rhodococcus (in: high G+C Gram-positive bacteria) TaxID=192944 RepID=UPI00338FD80F
MALPVAEARDQDGIIVARARIDTGAAGFVELLNVIASNGGTVTETPVVIETDKNLLVVALADAGFTVYPINPRAVARYRDRHRQAGGKCSWNSIPLHCRPSRTRNTRLH